MNTSLIIICILVSFSMVIIGITYKKQTEELQLANRAIESYRKEQSDITMFIDYYSILDNVNNNMPQIEAKSKQFELEIKKGTNYHHSMDPGHVITKLIICRK